jgi:hypothetical protein
MTADSVRAILMTVLVTLGIDTIPQGPSELVFWQISKDSVFWGTNWRLADDIDTIDLGNKASILRWDSTFDTLSIAMSIQHNPAYEMDCPTPEEFGCVVDRADMNYGTVVATLPGCYHPCVREWDGNGLSRVREYCPASVVPDAIKMDCPPVPRSEHDEWGQW